MNDERWVMMGLDGEDETLWWKKLRKMMVKEDQKWVFSFLSLLRLPLLFFIA